MVLKQTNKLLLLLLKTVAIVTFLNILVLYWIPIYIPISSFLAIRLEFVAFVERKYYLILISVLGCGLQFLGAVSISKRKFFLTILSYIYILLDFLILLSTLIDSYVRDDGQVWKYLVPMTVIVTLVYLMSRYIWKFALRRIKEG